ncbi:uncharacterized protein BDR25DRAFT_367738 [Lindgomyces ingoldianus]|uniref:Uncharacterized protein n=1 Tax=Lindgomyces ingoldianus TaxID=673940 RepID=A0ACB6QXT3_9PLEO|nr:uncharacterized protein BDR25DRAFT_367738 [Lindgomyces ingoldianus]KAF2471859.1 hypothetical protein BDR25DRAFT_367738 [Lindgomyces ingoldianus]
MSQAPLAQSADRAVLFARLGLSSQNESVHKMMLAEAQVGRDRLSTQPANLTAQSSQDPNVQPYYKWDEISETAKHREILAIVKRADFRTRPYYEMGSYYEGGNEENWVISPWYRCLVADLGNASWKFPRIHHMSGILTGGLFDGVFHKQDTVVRWYLWHSFRYRDNRDNSRNSKATVNGAHQGHPGPGLPWDPARHC